MSIDERLRSGLAANTEHLTSDLELERELSTVLRRAHRRTRTRRAGVVVLAVAAVLAVLAWLNGGLDLKRSDGPPDPIKTPKVTEEGPSSMEGVDGPLEAGSWAVPLVAPDYQHLPWAEVEVPEGYGSPGGWYVDRGADGDPNDYGDVSFWTVDTVAQYPCRFANNADPGPTVDDLADALHRRSGSRATRPVPVTLDGYSGQYLEVTVPDREQLATCVDETYTLWRGDGLAGALDIPGSVFHLWILDVDGIRVVVTATTTPHETDAETDEVLAIARSTHFVDPAEVRD